MPGMAANSQIFQHITLDKNKYNLHFLEWIEPLNNESIENYCQRLCKNITTPKPILVGVSFGGIIVQEIAKQIETEKVIIISSVKSITEFPTRMIWAKKWKLFRFFPTSYVTTIENITKKIVSSKKVKHRIDMYKIYLSVRSKNYLDWAFKNVILWKNDNPLTNVYHLHGTKDHIFPHKRIKNAHFLQNGTHIMIMTHGKWVSDKLRAIIENKI